MSAKTKKQAKTKKTKKARPEEAWLRSNFHEIEHCDFLSPCYVSFRGEFAGLGQVWCRHAVEGAEIATRNVRIPYVVMNRFGMTVWPNKVCNVLKLKSTNDMTVNIDKSEWITIAGKTFDCPPCHEQDNWSANWKFCCTIGSVVHTTPDGQVESRLVVNIVDKF